MIHKREICRICTYAVVLCLIFSVNSFSKNLHLTELPETILDDRPPTVTFLHNLNNVWSAFFNLGLFGDPWYNYPSMEWPGGEGSSYLWCGDFWSCCYGPVTMWGDSTAKWASCSDYGNWELRPSEGFPCVQVSPGPIATEETYCGYDDWDITSNSNPYGMSVYQELYSWSLQEYSNFYITDFIVTHHPSHGSGASLDAFVMAIRGDCDVAYADIVSCQLDDMVYYDGHAIWCNDPQATFEYEFDDGTVASQQDIYTYQQNPDSPLAPSHLDNIYYHYNYPGSDGIPDNDIDSNGVSDHFTILAKVTGSDTLFRHDPATGHVLFSNTPPGYLPGPGCGGQVFPSILPNGYFKHTVADTTYLVVPRNMSYIWDSDSDSSSVDDSGELSLNPPCNGYIGWRLLDAWIVRDGGSIERPFDVYNCPIPISHTYWNWEEDPGIDSERYDYMWGVNPSACGYRSGPSYMSNWIGNSNAAEAMMPSNPGPFPFVMDLPTNIGFEPFDYRFLISTGPVHLGSNDSLHVVGGWVIGRGLDGLRMNADLMLDAYCKEFSHCGLEFEDQPASVASVVITSITPNPVRSNHLSIEYNTVNHNNITGLFVYDISGRVVLDISLDELSNATNVIDLEIGNLDEGVYFIQLHTPNGVHTEKLIRL